MPRELNDKGRAFRRLVVEFDGDQNRLAAYLGVSQSAISKRLHSEMHGSWWRSYKKRRSKRRHAAYKRRYRQRLRERAASGAGLEPGGDV